MTDVAQQAQDIHDQLPADADVDTDEIEDRLDTLVNEYKVPMEEARRSVISNYLNETGADPDDLQSGNQEVDLADINEPEQWVDVTAKVVELWDPRSDAIGQVGLLGDETGTIKFTKCFDVPVKNVEATILGEHGDAQVPIFSKVRINGRDPTFTETNKEEILSNLQESAMHVIERKGATEWGPATGVSHMVEAILRDTGEVLPGNVVLEGKYEHNDVALGVPLQFGIDGVEEVVEWELSEFEREQFADAAQKLREQYSQID